MAIILIPNVIYAIKYKNDAADIYKNKFVIASEQIGRYCCLVFMIFNIPYTYYNFWFDSALTVYLSVNFGLCLIYLIFWVILFNKNGMLKALSLSVTPSCIFLISGIILGNIPLIVSAVIFSPSHILISCNNFKEKMKK